MQHFVQYHKSGGMRRSCAEIDALRIVTSKPVDALCGNTVWLLCGEGRPRAYYRSVDDTHRLWGVKHGDPT